MFVSDNALLLSAIELANYNYMFIKNELLYYNEFNTNNNIREGFRSQNKKGKSKRKMYEDDILNRKSLKPLIYKLYLKIFILLSIILSITLSIFIFFIKK